MFKDFCKELKIANIVEYEGGTLKEQRDRTERLNSLAKQVTSGAASLISTSVSKKCAGHVLCE